MEPERSYQDEAMMAQARRERQPRTVSDEQRCAFRGGGGENPCRVCPYSGEAG